MIDGTAVQLHDQIKLLRINRGISQVDLANALGVTKQSVSNWENDNIMPSIEMLIKIASYFSVTPDYLLGFEKGQSIDVSGLSDLQIVHLRLLIDDLRKNSFGKEE
ncbi:MAG: helix-turn-helix domain-containing protein [Treponemataceae bacterium]|nr:helix-turn-helix domain-containing protein [Treponemataceae bacterium]